MTYWQIRAARLEDIAAILDLWKDIDEIKSTIEDSYDNVEHFIKTNPGSMLVACSGTEIIGTVMGAYNGWRAAIYHFCVRDDHRRHSIGQALLQSALAHLKEQGAPRVDLYTYTDNRGAQAFYEMMGWQERDNIKNYSWIF